jgi:hypothetical protein
MVLFRLLLAALALAIQVLPRGSESHVHAIPQRGSVAIHDTLAHVHTEHGLGVSHEHEGLASAAEANEQNSVVSLRADEFDHESDAFYFVSSRTSPISPPLTMDHAAGIIAVATPWGQMLVEDERPATLGLAEGTHLALNQSRFSILLQTSTFLI